MRFALIALAIWFVAGLIAAPALAQFIKAGKGPKVSDIPEVDGPHASDCPVWVEEECACEAGKAYRGESR